LSQSARPVILVLDLYGAGWCGFWDGARGGVGAVWSGRVAGDGWDSRDGEWLVLCLSGLPVWDATECGKV